MCGNSLWDSRSQSVRIFFALALLEWLTHFCTSLYSWRRDKEFIEAGRIAAAERGVQYLGDNELDRLQAQLQKTMDEIHKERAKKAMVSFLIFLTLSVWFLLMQ